VAVPYPWLDPGPHVASNIHSTAPTRLDAFHENQRERRTLIVMPGCFWRGFWEGHLEDVKI
jgi:hypothetical protein